MDNIIITKLWKDNDFYQVKFDFVSDLVCCKTVTYVVPSEINELSFVTLQFINSNNNSVKWEIGEKESEDSPYINFEICKLDKLGHIIIKVNCDILSSVSDGGYSCFFPIKTEIGLLKVFADNIVELNYSETGTVICLNNTQS